MKEVCFPESNRYQFEYKNFLINSQFKLTQVVELETIKECNIIYWVLEDSLPDSPVPYQAQVSLEYLLYDVNVQKLI